MPSPKSRENVTVGEWLGNSGPLLQRANLLAKMNRSLQHWCNEAWIQHVRIANVRDDVVIIYSASAAALVPLRSRQSELLAYLNAGFGLGCQRVEAKTRPA